MHTLVYSYAIFSSLFLALSSAQTVFSLTNCEMPPWLFPCIIICFIFFTLITFYVYQMQLLAVTQLEIWKKILNNFN